MFILKKVFKGVCNLVYKHVELSVLVLGWGSAIIFAFILRCIDANANALIVSVTSVAAMAIAIFGTRFFVHWAEAFELMEDDWFMTAREAWKQTKMDRRKIMKWWKGWFSDK